jgi:hypothetical protein
MCSPSSSHPPPHTHTLLSALPCFPRTQLLRYTAPFMFISGVFWLLHTWLLDPMPNSFRRQEFLRYRRELMHVASKLNFRWVSGVGLVRGGQLVW